MHCSMQTLEFRIKTEVAKRYKTWFFFFGSSNVDLAFVRFLSCCDFLCSHVYIYIIYMYVIYV
jgi:hypothetical protein